MIVYNFAKAGNSRKLSQTTPCCPLPRGLGSRVLGSKPGWLSLAHAAGVGCVTFIVTGCSRQCSPQYRPQRLRAEEIRLGLDGGPHRSDQRAGSWAPVELWFREFWRFQPRILARNITAGHNLRNGDKASIGSWSCYSFFPMMAFYFLKAGVWRAMNNALPSWNKKVNMFIRHSWRPIQNECRNCQTSPRFLVPRIYAKYTCSDCLRHSSVAFMNQQTRDLQSEDLKVQKKKWRIMKIFFNKQKICSSGFLPKCK